MLKVMPHSRHLKSPNSKGVSSILEDMLADPLTKILSAKMLKNLTTNMTLVDSFHLFEY